MKQFPVLILLLLLALAACKKAQNPLAKPSIAFSYISHDSVVNGSLKDTVIIAIRYTIDAAKVGKGTTIAKVHVIDSRDTTKTDIPVPDDVSDGLTGDEVNINGVIEVKLPAAQYMILRPDHPDRDTITYEIYMSDKDGIESNRLTAPSLYIVP